MADVFISYSRSDRDFVLQLVGALKTRGFSVWHDDRIDYGEEWWQRIEKEIVGCRFFLVTMSAEARESKWVRRELHVAEHHSKELFPILLNGEPFSMFLGTQYATLNDDGFLDAGFFDRLGGARIEPVSLAESGREFTRGQIEERAATVQRAAEARPDASLSELVLIASDGDHAIAALVTEALERAGVHGGALVFESKSVETTVEMVPGTWIERGFLSPYFVDEKHGLTGEYDYCRVLVHGTCIESLASILPLLEKTAQAGRSIVFIGGGLDEEVLATLVINKIRGTLKSAAVKEPDPGVLQEIGRLCGTPVVDDEAQLAAMKLQDLGEADVVVIEKDRTTILHRKCYRKNAISPGVAVLSMGGYSEGEIRENSLRALQALSAMQAYLRSSEGRTRFPSG